MTDELTPEQEAAVRRLLSEARHDEPVPAEVAARLDAELDRLVADEGAGQSAGQSVGQSVGHTEVESGSPGAVTELACVRHRRRKAGRLLLAAAAVVVGGVALGQSLGGTSFDGDDAGGSADSAVAEAPPREGASRAQDEPEVAAEDGAGDTGGGDEGGDDAGAGSAAPSPADVGLLAELEAPVQLSSDSFAADVQRELSRTAAERRRAANSDFDGVTAYALNDSAFTCPDGDYGKGATLPAYYDAEEAVLVLRRPRAGIQRVDLLTCGTAMQLNSVELPAP